MRVDYCGQEEKEDTHSQSKTKENNPIRKKYTTITDHEKKDTKVQCKQPENNGNTKVKAKR
jgi:hypothetical protein